MCDECTWHHKTFMAPQNIPRAISVLTLGNKVILLIVDFVDKSCGKIFIPEKSAGENLS